MPVIPFDARERLIFRAKEYISHPDIFLSEKKKAVPLLIRALKFADQELRANILFLLCSFSKEDIAWPLYDIMTNQEESDDIKDQAAIQLSVISPFLSNPQSITRKLINDLEMYPENKIRSILALGWEGNLTAALPLINCLYDEDPEVQEVAITALCNLKDSRVIGFLAERLKECSNDQKLAIFFNLWKFKDKGEEVLAVYKTALQQCDPSIRLEVMDILGQEESDEHIIRLYKHFLGDREPTVRGLVLERLWTMDALKKDEILPFLEDPSMEVKRIALKIFQEIKKSH